MTTILTAQRPDPNRLSTDIMADDYTQEEIWSSPAPAGRPRTPRTPKTPKTPTQEREPIDHEAALRKELEGVRNINESIEGVIATLERAGGNMDVRAVLRVWLPRLLTSIDRIQNSKQCIRPPQHMDSDIITDRA
ncbi:hypothetical protein N0V84_001372 [Fusarium piperis]|uniref:Uncharacterized protein n=1 Tax=Fusarium piperis TaxID=1435070 RepID=A0A9W8WLJ7_9HYPO|nr:hypothetical protein N0V84_001372 [Fusarium piperis]